MSSIKDFSKNYQNHNIEKDMENSMKENPDKVEDIKKNIERYQNFSQEELMSELIKEASNLKASGVLNESSINTLKNTLSPMLSATQNQKLDEIINKIK